MQVLFKTHDTRYLIITVLGMLVLSVLTIAKIIATSGVI